RTMVKHGKSVGVSDLHIQKATQVAEKGNESLVIAHRAGVRMAFGSDLFRAPKQYQCDEFLIRAEVLEPAEVLRHATVNAAALLRMEGRIGRIAACHSADILVVEGYPVADLSLLNDQGRRMPRIIKNGRAYKDTI